MKEIHRQLISGLAASACLGGFAYWTDETFGVNVMMSAVIGFGTYIILPPTPDPRDIKLAFGVSKAQLDEALQQIDVYIDKFNELLRRSREDWLRDAIRRIVIVLKNIAAKFKQDPKDLQIPCTTLFMDQYMVQSYYMIRDHVRLWNHAVEDGVRAELKPTTAKVERVVAGYTAYYRQCLLDGLIDLRAGNETMKTILNSELAPYRPGQNGRH